MESEFKVEPYGVKYVCEKCGVGEMLYTNRSDWSVAPPQHEHKCPKCSAVVMLEEKYPIIRYKRI